LSEKGCVIKTFFFNIIKSIDLRFYYFFYSRG
jgi:hypothetical protein